MANTDFSLRTPLAGSFFSDKPLLCRGHLSALPFRYGQFFSFMLILCGLQEAFYTHFDLRIRDCSCRQKAHLRVSSCPLVRCYMGCLRHIPGYIEGYVGVVRVKTHLAGGANNCNCACSGMAVVSSAGFEARHRSLSLYNGEN
ncbi:hypothetical protein MNBD_GAMMA09-2134 [hydrothermal vent metagenome]|uniref:Uncharacterized protein n=1 Tax=hydrothermal vent metagenome TaxID=652676 RepID=A0A3B0XSA8_9ZZZZ